MEWSDKGVEIILSSLSRHEASSQQRHPRKDDWGCSNIEQPRAMSIGTASPALSLKSKLKNINLTMTKLEISNLVLLIFPDLGRVLSFTARSDPPY